MSMPKTTTPLALGASLLSGMCAAQEISERVEEKGAQQVVEERWSHVGLLRARDLTPFGLLRLDMLPAYTADAAVDEWTFEAKYAYQNTFVLSDNARDYLETRNIGRRPLREQDGAAILALPGDAYLIDGEVGYADLIVQRRTSEYWSVYLTIPYIQ